MKFWTAHIRPDGEPVLIREGFSWGALLFGPLWLALHRSWIAAVTVLAVEILIAALVREPFTIAFEAGLALLMGVSGNDLRRWSLDHRGYLLSNVLAARNEAEALARLLASRPDLTGRFMPAGTAR